MKGQKLSLQKLAPSGLKKNNTRSAFRKFCCLVTSPQVLQDFVVVKHEPGSTSTRPSKSRKVWKIEDLPAGSNTDNEWKSIIVPNFINLVLAGDEPWTTNDKLLIPMLQQVWSKTHGPGREKSFEIKVNTAPWQLVSTSSSHISTTYCLSHSFC
jgi:hypothetical protein